MELQLRVLKQGLTSRTGPAVFLVVREEDYILPSFFKHYHRLGFEEFWVYADRCTPATMEILAAQPEVTIVAGDYEYGQAFGEELTGGPRRLVSALKETSVDMLPDKWVLVADADEFLVLPPPAKTIDEMIAALERARQPYATAPMVDMYPQCLALRNHPRTIEVSDISIFFDAGPYYTWEPEKIAPEMLHAGVRDRMLQLLSQQFAAELVAIYGDRPVAASAIYKVPLLKHGNGIRSIDDHAINVGTSTANGMAFAHYKFTPCLDRKIETAVKERQYLNGSAEYRWLALAKERIPFENLVCSRTRLFTGPDSFVAADLISPLD